MKKIIALQTSSTFGLVATLAVLFVALFAALSASNVYADTTTCTKINVPFGGHVDRSITIAPGGVVQADSAAGNSNTRAMLTALISRVHI
jgi:hypothetical protein